MFENKVTHHMIKCDVTIRVLNSMNFDHMFWVKNYSYKFISGKWKCRGYVLIHVFLYFNDHMYIFIMIKCYLIISSMH